MYSFKYSVIIPFRDSIEQLSQAINSIPDRDDIQIIAVDNSKVLYSKEIYPVLTNANLVVASSKYGAGAGTARNEGLKCAQGEWLLFLDADDYFVPNAFDAFDTYVNSKFDIVFFKADSINLTTGMQSHRHEGINQHIDDYLSNKSEDNLRYRFGNPVCKMIKHNLISNYNIKFEEVKYANDVMFSTISGHNANTISADPTIVYMITEAAAGGSLTTDTSSDNNFIRFQVAVRRYKYMKSIGRPDVKPKFLSYILYATVRFGIKETWKYLKYYFQNIS